MNMWTEWKPFWKDLPEGLFFHILSFVDDIDIRRAFKMPIRPLQLTDTYKNQMNDFLNDFQTGICIKYKPETRVLHVLSHLYDDYIDDKIFSHKVIQNVQFQENAYGNAYFTNVLNNHTEYHYKYWYYTNLSLFIEKITRQPYILFNFTL